MCARAKTGPEFDVCLNWPLSLNEPTFQLYIVCRDCIVIISNCTGIVGYVVHRTKKCISYSMYIEVPIYNTYNIYMCRCVMHNIILQTTNYSQPIHPGLYVTNYHFPNSKNVWGYIG